MTCSRCGKAEATLQIGIPDPDLPMIPVCEGCKHLAWGEMLGWLGVQKRGTTKEWRDSFDKAGPKAQEDR